MKRVGNFDLSFEHHLEDGYCFPISTVCLQCCARVKKQSICVRPAFFGKWWDATRRCPRWESSRRVHRLIRGRLTICFATHCEHRTDKSKYTYPHNHWNPPYLLNRQSPQPGMRQNFRSANESGINRPGNLAVRLAARTRLTIILGADQEQCDDQSE